jgi:hypothetical protein
MSQKDVIRAESIGEQLVAEWCADSADSILFVEKVWRPALAVRPLANQIIAAFFLWIAMHLESTSYVTEALCRLLFGAVAVLVSYLGVAEFLNRTTVKLGRTGLSVRHRPLPWPGNCDVPLAALTVARTMTMGDEVPRYAVEVIAGLKPYTAITGIGSELEAQRVTDVLNESIDRLQHLGEPHRHSPG